MSNNRTINTAKNLSIGAGTQILSLLLSFGIRTAFVVTLGIEYLSVNGLFANILTLLSFTELGIGSAINYSLYKPFAEDDREQIGKLTNLLKRAYNYIAIIILILGLCVVPFLKYIITDVPNIKENIPFLYILFLLNTVVSYVYGYKKSVLIADQKNYIVISIYTVLNTVMIFVQIGILYFLRSFTLFLIAMIIFTLLNNIIATLYVNRKYPWIKDVEKLQLEKNEILPIFQNIKNIVIYKLGSVLLNGSSSIIISGLIKTTLVGLCSNYSMIISSVTTIINQGVAGIAASIGNYNVTATKSDNEKVFQQLSLLSFWAIGVVSLGMACLLTPFVRIWLGEKYLLDDYVVILLVLGFYMLMINSIPSSYRTAMGFFKEARLAPLLAAFLNIVLGVIGAKLWGLLGVFGATVLARLLTYCIIDPYIVYRKGFDKSPFIYYARFICWIIILSISYLISDYLISTIKVVGMKGLIVSSIISIVIFNIIFFICYWRNDTLHQALYRLKFKQK